VIDGTWQYDIDGKSVTAKAGDVLFVPARTVHSAKNVGKGNASELATYIVEKGQPLLTLVK
jgi:mannose-6-phosphate isomerase-like protein (cupin superfamily)